MNRKRGRRPANRHDLRDIARRPSTYIRPFEIRPGDKIWLWCRVSTGRQNLNGNNDDQEAELRAKVTACGGVVVGVTRFEGRAGDAESDLYRAAKSARAVGAILLAESTSRFARHLDYNSKKYFHRTAGFCELQDLHWVCGETVLMTVLNPDSTFEEERSYQSKRGQRQKERLGGRPCVNLPGYKKRKRKTLLPEVQRLLVNGMSFRAIARTLETDERNVRRWVRRF